MIWMCYHFVWYECVLGLLIYAHRMSKKYTRCADCNANIYTDCHMVYVHMVYGQDNPAFPWLVGVKSKVTLFNTQKAKLTCIWVPKNLHLAHVIV